MRKFMARFNMRQMSVGDEVLFHHSSVDPPGVAGLARLGQLLRQVLRVRAGLEQRVQHVGRQLAQDPPPARQERVWCA